MFVKNSLLLAMLALSACSSQPINFSVPDVVPSPVKLNAELKTVAISVASDDEKTGDLPAVTANITAQWKAAVEEAIDKMAIFKDDAPRKVSLMIKVRKLDMPIGGFDMTTDTSARYELIDRKDGSPIFMTDIDASGTTSVGYAFLGQTRMIESVNRSVQNNIAAFLMQLETVDLSQRIPTVPPSSSE